MMPDMLESGTLNLPGIAGLGEGIREAILHMDEAREKTAALCDMMRSELLDIPGVRLYTQRGAMLLSFNIGGVASQETAALLDAEGIAVRGGLHCAPGVHRFLNTLETGAVRVSPGLYSTRADALALAAAVKRIAKGA